MRATRSGVRSAVLLAVVIAAGLASRRYADLLPGPVQKRTGDALWAWAAFAGVGLLRPRWPTGGVALAATGIAFADEFSQAYHAPWIDGLRAHTLGHLILGSGFYWLDFVAYLVGVAAAVPVDHWLLRRPLFQGRPKSPDSACVP